MTSVLETNSNNNAMMTDEEELAILKDSIRMDYQTITRLGIAISKLERELLETKSSSRDSNYVRGQLDLHRTEEKVIKDELYDKNQRYNKLSTIIKKKKLDSGDDEELKTKTSVRGDITVTKNGVPTVFHINSEDDDAWFKKWSRVVDTVSSVITRQGNDIGFIRTLPLKDSQLVTSGRIYSSY